jgi:5'-3' exonuclease
MGIRGMNRFMRMFCPEAIKYVKFDTLRGKRIAFDMSIYMYRFKKEKTLVADMFTLFHQFKDCGIIPLFVFDGEPPKEKKQELKERRRLKAEATEKYERLKTELTEKATELEEAVKEEKMRELSQLEREFVTLKNSDISKMKTLIEAFGFAYIFASGEADCLCAALELSGAVDAVMSEDGDMVAYGCSTILRVPNLVMGTCELFDVAMVRRMLGISVPMIREMCVLSGTDYNVHAKKGEDSDSDSDGDGNEDGAGDGDSDTHSAITMMDFFNAYTIMNELRSGPTAQDLSDQLIRPIDMRLLDEMLRIKKIDADTYEVHTKTLHMYELNRDKLDEATMEFKAANDEISEYNEQTIKTSLRNCGVLVC